MARSLSRQPARRSPVEWVLRAGIAAVALVMGYVSTTQTLAFTIGKADAERAHALAPRDGRISGYLAEHLAESDSSTAQRQRADQLARQALIEEPLSVPALTALAFDTQLVGSTAHARRLFLHSDALSRRGLGTRLWLIEDAVRSGNVTGALRHYDIALRTTTQASDILFPVLSQAITEPSIAQALVDTLAEQPVWSDTFIDYLASSGKNADKAASLFRILSDRGVRISPFAQAAVVNRLVANGAFDEGWAYYRSLRPVARRNMSRNPEFNNQIDAPSVFDWIPVTTDAGVTASLQRTTEGGIFDFSVPATVGGVILQQVQILPIGRFRLDGMSAGINQDNTSRLYWQLSCLSGREIGRVEVPNSVDNGGRFVGQFYFDGSCPAQVLRLIASPSFAIGGATGQITRALLSPSG